jgi:hypothetical protein
LTAARPKLHGIDLFVLVSRRTLLEHEGGSIESLEAVLNEEQSEGGAGRGLMGPAAGDSVIQVSHLLAWKTWALDRA